MYRPYSQRAQLVVLKSGPCQLSGYKFKLQLDSDLLARVSSQATGDIFAKPLPLPWSLGAEALTVTGRILCIHIASAKEASLRA